MQVFWINKNSQLNLTHGKSVKRKLNSLLVTAQMKLKHERILGYPRHLIVDLINVCGLKCPICPQGRCEIPRKPAQMTLDLFSSILKHTGPYLYTLTLTNWGEPLLHPQICELIHEARKYPAYLGFSSNLQHLSDELAQELILSGIDEIGCSIDGLTQDVYEKYRAGGSLEIAMNNMLKLIEYKKRAGVKRPKIRWQFLMHRYNEHQLEDVEKTAREIGVDSLVFIPMFIDIARMFTHSPAERLKRDGDWLPKNQDLSCYNYETGELKQRFEMCSKLWDSMVIQPDGSVSPCCAVIESKHDFGKLKSGADIKVIWNNESYRLSRRRISRKSADPVQLVCENCYRNGVLI